uniref:Hint domain-containing protein n=1 Tax=Plectus sambesii TaxID=2011161 RepID=A0A914UWB9_9BILA
MADLQIGDRILTINSDGNIVASPIILFLDRSVNVVDQYVLVTLTDNQELRMSPDHLIFRLKNRQSFKSDADHRALKLLWNSGNVSHEMRHITGNDSGHFKTPRPLRLGYFNDHRFEPPDVSSTTGLWSLTEATLAKNLQRGDFVLQRDADNDHLLWVKVTAIGKIYDRGAYAPLTAEGTLLVNGVVASCYAATRHEKLAHFSMAPIRWLSYLTTFERSSGLHFYAKLLMNIADVIEMFSAIQLYN